MTENSAHSYNDIKADKFLAWLKGPVREFPSFCSEDPLFSIVVPVYNREGDITNCLKSLQLQDFTGFEIIVIDDASTDRTALKVACLAQRDPRIRLIRLDDNIGPGSARNIGIRQARGKYIRICDSDDFYPAGALSAFARRIAEEESDLIVGNLLCWHSLERQLRPHEGPWQICRNFRSGDLREVSELWAMVQFHRCAFRRAFLMENCIEYPALRRGEDPVYMANVLALARSFSLFPEPVYVFHARPRNPHFSYEELRDAIAAHKHIFQIMCDAGYPELGHFFDCYYPPFTLSHARLTEEASLNISEQLIDFASRFPPEILEHPYLDYSACDKIALHHDVLVARSFCPEVVAELMRRGMFCGQAHLQNAQSKPLREAIRVLCDQLGLLRFPLKIYRALKRRMP